MNTEDVPNIHFFCSEGLWLEWQQQGSMPSQWVTYWHCMKLHSENGIIILLPEPTSTRVQAHRLVSQWGGSYPALGLTSDCALVTGVWWHTPSGKYLLWDCFWDQFWVKICMVLCRIWQTRHVGLCDAVLHYKRIVIREPTSKMRSWMQVWR